MPVETVVLSGSALLGIEQPHLHSIATAPQTVHLGRNRPKSRPMALSFEKFFDPARMLVGMPTSIDYAAKAKASISRMYDNADYGCCVISAKYHGVGVWSGNDSPTTVVGTDQEVLAAYRIWNPGNQDNGCNMSEVLDYMKAHGFPFMGVRHGIDGYMSCNWTKQDMAKAAIYLFGNLDLGINLPQAWTSASVWDTTNTAIVGGHNVLAVGYNQQGVQVSSWGRLYTITWAAFLATRWLEECYCLLGPDWYGNDKLAPSGVDVDALKKALDDIGGGTIPPIDPTPVPPIPPIPPIPPTPVPPSTGERVAISAWADFKDGASVGTVTGTCSRKVAGSDPSDISIGNINWLLLLGDVFALYAAIQTRNVMAIIAALQKLANDIGIKVAFTQEQ